MGSFGFTMEKHCTFLRENPFVKQLTLQADHPCESADFVQFIDALSSENRAILQELQLYQIETNNVDTLALDDSFSIAVRSLIIKNCSMDVILAVLNTQFHEGFLQRIEINVSVVDEQQCLQGTVMEYLVSLIRRSPFVESIELRGLLQTYGGLVKFAIRSCRSVHNVSLDVHDYQDYDKHLGYVQKILNGILHTLMSFFKGPSPAIGHERPCVFEDLCWTMPLQELSLSGSSICKSWADIPGPKIVRLSLMLGPCSVHSMRMTHYSIFKRISTNSGVRTSEFSPKF